MKPDRLPVERRVLGRSAPTPRCACSVTSPRSCSSRMPRSSAWPRMAGIGHRHLARAAPATLTNGSASNANGAACSASTKLPAAARQHAEVAAVGRVAGERQHERARRLQARCDRDTQHRRRAGRHRASTSAWPSALSPFTRPGAAARRAATASRSPATMSAPAPGARSPRGTTTRRDEAQPGGHAHAVRHDALVERGAAADADIIPQHRARRRARPASHRRARRPRARRRGPPRGRRRGTSPGSRPPSRCRRTHAAAIIARTAPGCARDQLAVDPGHGVGRLVRVERRRTPTHSTAWTPMKCQPRFAGPGSREARDAAVVVDRHAAVVQRVRVRDDGHRDRAPARAWRARKRREVEIGERVAVDEEEPLRVEQRQRAGRTARAPEDARLPRVAHAHAERAAVADGRRHRRPAGDAGSAPRRRRPPPASQRRMRPASGTPATGSAGLAREVRERRAGACPARP